ncbi:MAG: Signal transduction histidine kinase, nitrogen specific, NtrB [Pedosphaera sp.]|nr:Signal transduction histidine kinase, nitrogen specific, NtrB [Pedosphaera sp.]
MAAMKMRLTGFALAIVLVAFMIAWAAHASWLRVAKLGEKLTSVQIASFRTADYFRANLVDLNYTLLRYEIHHNPSDRKLFLKNLNKLNEWIDVQSPLLTTAKEAHILDQINAAYDGYFAAATNHLQKIDSHTTSLDSGFSDFEKVGEESNHLLELAYQLVDAHHESLARFVADSQRSLGFLRVLIFASLFLMLMLVAWLAGVVYREMIHPLRLKLVESNAIIERQEKLASLGVLAAGVAHEIRNPLTAIKARLFTQQKALRSGSPEFEDAAVIGNEINRLERIVKGVLQFARPPEPNLTTLSAAATLREVHDLMAPQLAGTSIELKLELNGNAFVRADSEQLKQVLINLIQNAAESIKIQGLITLRERVGNARLSGQQTQVVILEVEDTGKGISPEVQKRLFDPFFSTKETGTGLGLSIAARILEKHGGALEFQTQVNHGTTFGVILPQVQTT